MPVPVRREGAWLRKGYVVPAGRGIVSQALETGEPYVANVVAKDAHYLPHPYFKKDQVRIGGTH